MAGMIPYVHNVYRNRLFKFKGFLLTLYLRAHGCKVGKGLRANQWPVFRAVPDGNIEIGNYVSLGTNIVLQPLGKGRIILDDHSKLIHDVYIAASERIYIGKHSGIAERCSIRDTEHGIRRDTPMYSQEVITHPVHIGSDVQISLGSSVLAGSHIEDGVIIGAGCIITRNVRTVPYGIYFGNPPRMIGKRPK